MPRGTLPLALAITGMLAAAALAASRYTDLFAGANSDTELYNLIARAAGEAPAPERPLTGQSPLPITSLERTDSAAAPVEPDTVATQPRDWLAAAALADREALRGWLGPLVIATAGIRSADTFAFTLHRFTLRRGCALFATLEASELVDTSGAGHRPRLVRLRGNCPRVEHAP